MFRAMAVVTLLLGILAACVAVAPSAPWQEAADEGLDHLQAGRLEEAGPPLEEALRIAESEFGPQDPNLAVSLNNLGSLYGAQDRYAEAERLLLRALAIREGTLGPEHPEVAASLRNLAWLLTRQGRYPEATALDRRALAIREAALGPEHRGRPQPRQPRSAL
jgi:tetratricopeptide (TPR) repeat protein